ncbi:MULTISPECIES: hypothetical protein [unclassified Streptomyces]|uniref:hypothetical protein n=1 Tax=unclassified Streptomyces TaxID=2593676 RepID=UPI0018FEA695|nr:MULTISPECIES: hypothetical protein [unclassified Streptomyces]
MLDALNAWGHDTSTLENANDAAARKARRADHDLWWERNGTGEYAEVPLFWRRAPVLCAFAVTQRMRFTESEPEPLLVNIQNLVDLQMPLQRVVPCVRGR